ncbi:MAG: hypothetical protein ACR2J3_03355 [Aridibacter sp.]
MNCEKYQNLIEYLAENELDEQTAADVTLHIFDCTNCSLKYETLKREKEIYSQYLFTVEPPKDMWQNFQAKLKEEREEKPTVLATPTSATVWKTILSRFSIQIPIFASVILMIILGLGFGIWKFNSDAETSNNEFVAKTELKNDSPIIKKSDTFQAKDKIDLLNKDKKSVSEKVLNNKHELSKKKKTVKKSVKSIRVKAKKSVNENVGEEPLKIAEISEEEKLQNQRLKKLDGEIAKQIEKTEIMLRSFRNARLSDGGQTFDIGYEQEQARKLLDKNVELRQIAGFYGNSYAEEILSKTEPLLLDIANLENDPLPNKVLDIKERLSNQNIIASLQVYQ